MAADGVQTGTSLPAAAASQVGTFVPAAAASHGRTLGTMRNLRRPKVIEPPEYTTIHRPRVLVEEPDGAMRTSYVNLLRRSGIEAIGCGGPEDQENARCPIEAGTGCDAAELADVIFFSFRLADDRSREILRGLKRMHPRTPIVVEVPKPQAFRYQDVLRGVSTVYAPVTSHSLTKAVLDAWQTPDPILETLRR